MNVVCTKHQFNAALQVLIAAIQVPEAHCGLCKPNSAAQALLLAKAQRAKTALLLPAEMLQHLPAAAIAYLALTYNQVL